MAQANRTNKSDPNTADVADRIILSPVGEDPYKDAYAEGVENLGKPKTVDPYEKPELNQLNQDGFIGVDPIYQNYASVGGRPLNGDDKVTGKASNGSVPDLEDVVVDENAGEGSDGSGSNPNSDNSNADTKPTEGAPAVVPPIPSGK